MGNVVDGLVDFPVLALAYLARHQVLVDGLHIIKLEKEAYKKREFSMGSHIVLGLSK